MWTNIQKKKWIKNKITNRYGRIIQIHTPTDRQACPREGYRVARADGQRETERWTERDRERAKERGAARTKERGAARARECAKGEGG
jgi:hypothetical protein